MTTESTEEMRVRNEQRGRADFNAGPITADQSHMPALDALRA